jgi:glycosyltransferase involved in cell wall biosynthesis
VEEIWPAIAAAAPEARLILAGSSPTPRLLALDLDRVLVPGKLDDLDPLFSRARVFVAPLRFGAGVKGKIFTAMAHGVPVVTTPMGIEGAQLVAGVDVLVAADSAEFARTVLQLYSDEALWAGLSAHGRRWIRDNASLKTGISAIRAAIQMSGLSN